MKYSIHKNVLFFKNAHSITQNLQLVNFIINCEQFLIFSNVRKHKNLTSYKKITTVNIILVFIFIESDFMKSKNVLFLFLLSSGSLFTMEVSTTKEKAQEKTSKQLARLIKLISPIKDDCLNPLLGVFSELNNRPIKNLGIANFDGYKIGTTQKNQLVKNSNTFMNNLHNTLESNKTVRCYVEGIVGISRGEALICVFKQFSRYEETQSQYDELETKIQTLKKSVRESAQLAQDLNKLPGCSWDKLDDKLRVAKNELQDEKYISHNKISEMEKDVRVLKMLPYLQSVTPNKYDDGTTTRLKPIGDALKPILELHFENGIEIQNWTKIMIKQCESSQTK